MREIRSFSEEHVAEVAAMHLRVMQGRKGVVSKALEEYFRVIFLRNPWVCPDIHSLVCFENGAPVGFLGIFPRLMQFRGRPIRVGVSTQFIVDRERHRGPAAIELLSRFFKGPQDLCFTDGADDSVHFLWEAAGGHSANAYSFNWIRPLRPLRTAESYIARRKGALGLAGRVLLAGMAPVEYLLAKAPVAALRPPQSPFESRPVNADELLQAIQQIGWREALKPEYEISSFRWLMEQTAAARSRGDLKMATVYSPDGVLSGWYTYWIQPRGTASLLQIGVRRRDQFDSVLLAMFRDAWHQGASSVKGQAIPQYLVNLTNQYCIFRHAHTSVLFQSRDKELVEAIYGGKAALSRLDGECWMHFAGEHWA